MTLTQSTQRLKIMQTKLANSIWPSISLKEKLKEKNISKGFTVTIVAVVKV
jgi:hypothetical protein